MITNVLQTFLGGIWKWFIQTDFPGLNVSVASVAISFLLIRLSISLFQFVSGFSGSGSDYGRASTNMDRFRYRKQWDNGRLLPSHKNGW